jgi:hypothetical protein
MHDPLLEDSEEKSCLGLGFGMVLHVVGPKGRVCIAHNLVA